MPSGGGMVWCLFRLKLLRVLSLFRGTRSWSSGFTFLLLRLHLSVVLDVSEPRPRWPGPHTAVGVVPYPSLAFPAPPLPLIVTIIPIVVFLLFPTTRASHSKLA